MRIPKGLLIFIALVCLISLPVLLFFSCDLFPVTKLAEVDVGNNRTISIYGESCWEISRAIYYEAHEGRKVVVPQTLWEFDDPDEIYTLEFISTENRYLVGVYDSDRTIDEFFIIIDFRTGESWPRFIDSLESSLGKQRAFLKQLRKENPDIIQIPTPFPTVSLPTTIATPPKPTPTNTLVIQPTGTLKP